MSSWQLISLIALALLVLFARHVWVHPQRPFPLPPGPKGWPIIGNIFDVPKEKLHIAYMDMGRKYGSDLLYLNVAGTSLLILNSEEAANDLLVESFNVTDSKMFSNLQTGFPHAFPSSGGNQFPEVLAGKNNLKERASTGSVLRAREFMGWDFNFGFLPYGNRWRKSRAVFMQQFSASNLETLQKPILQESIYLFLKKLLDTPKDFEDHIRFLSGGTIISSLYGMSPFNNPQHGSYLELAKKANQSIVEAGIPGTMVPGAGFKRKAAYERRFVQQMYNEPVESVKRNMASGTTKSCVVSRVLQDMQDNGAWSEEKEDFLKMASGTAYSAGSDTTAIALTVVVLALVRNPEILQKGKAAVDAVVGPDRLPNYDDEGKIPYVDALIMEALRWRPVTPLAVPHQTVSADVYKGYYIPSHTTVLANCWAFLHNPEIYGEDVTQFHPERFLNPDGTLNSKIPYPDAAFGFGRRVCPGKAFAQCSLWLAVASLLVCFDFARALDKDGVEIDPSTDCMDGMLSCPPPFECSIMPRSKAVEELIRESYERQIS
ncbi:cytochrome P450 [Gymnopus androsaceus JB14]|uniref:Cytochrome P450 n=1 Tax=Gymnopus androsaceus JB14 TaxID=1447944 RepID=A0A6A4GSF3_9AGAR|nr:cytochrome P450 [Gymnopus androsaceus JB14]